MRIVDMIGASLPAELRRSGAEPAVEQRDQRIVLTPEQVAALASEDAEPQSVTADWTAWDARVGVILPDDGLCTVSYDGLNAHLHFRVRAGRFEARERVVAIPPGAILPDDPEFSAIGSRRRGTQRPVVMKWADFAAVVARRLPGNPESWDCDDAAELAEKVAVALRESLELGQSVAAMIDVYPVTPKKESK